MNKDRFAIPGMLPADTPNATASQLSATPEGGLDLVIYRALRNGLPPTLEVEVMDLADQLLFRATQEYIFLIEDDVETLLALKIPAEDILLVPGSVYVYVYQAGNTLSKLTVKVEDTPFLLSKSQTRGPLALPPSSTTPVAANVRYDHQTLTAPQQAQARENIGAITSADLAPVIPSGTILPAVPAVGGAWLATAGQVVSQAAYPTLFKLLGHRPEFAWTPSKIYATDRLRHIAFGASVYVAVGAAGSIHTSADKVTWTPRTSGVSSALHAVIWDADNSLFVAVGAVGVILTSPNGTTWTARASGVTAALNNIQRGATISSANVTMIVGDDGVCGRSVNSTAWSFDTLGTVSRHHLIRHTNSWFAAPRGEASGSMVCMVADFTWAAIAKPTSNNYSFLGCSTGYLFVLDVVSGEIFKSPTGVTWTSAGEIPTTARHGESIHPDTISWSSGVITLLGSGAFGCTADNFATTDLLEVNDISMQSRMTFLSVPSRHSVQKFAIVLTGTGVGQVTNMLVSADGRRWRAVPTGTMTRLGNYFYLTMFANSHYFLSNGRQVLSAPEPYNPATHFQIPTRTDAAGNTLFIKT